MKSFDSLNEREILALAIGQEETDSRIYGDLAEGIRAQYPATAEALDRMRQEEATHRDRLLDLYRRRFGEHIPMIRREDVRGFVKRRPVWLIRPLGLNVIRKLASTMEAETRQFYERAAARATDVGVRQLLNQLGDEERKHSALAEQLDQRQKDLGLHADENETRRRLFVLQIVQPGLAGLMDGSVSTLAPLFAAAFATGSSIDAFKVGLAASVGAGISMGFAEALSDDGSLTGRGHPWLRGAVCGLMTTLGGIGHTLPFLIPNFHQAVIVAIVVVAIELVVISWIRNHYMDTPFLSAAFQVIVGGTLVFLAGILIGRGG
jgi:rubrerythrin